mgnify:CR=1 FL=1|tara:strand:- start:1957 stop:3171 length:1215 start_codon:yes stop_codon:yes gene_type:complete
MINTFINEVSQLYIMMAPYLIMGFIISGFLFVLTSKEMITKNVGTPGLGSILKAAFLGVPMPLCSCGVIPVATSMYKRGATKGATLSFLISTPQTGVDSILLTLNQMGPQFAIIRPIVALITGVVGGIIGEKLSDSDHITKSKINHSHDKKSIQDGIKYAFITLPKDIINPLIKGILISGVISVLVPSDFFISYNINGILAMILIGIASVPMYVCATASVPIAMVLISKGLDPGAAFVFLMAGPATNAATISVIMNSLGKRVIYIYISIIFTFAIIFGTLINIFLNPASLPINLSHNHSHNIVWDLFSNISIFIMLAITWYAIFKKEDSFVEENNNSDLKIIVKGMTCNHCKQTATEAIQNCKGVKSVDVYLESGEAVIFGDSLDTSEIFNAIKSVGFSASKFS